MLAGECPGVNNTFNRTPPNSSSSPSSRNFFGSGDGSLGRVGASGPSGVRSTLDRRWFWRLRCHRGSSRNGTAGRSRCRTGLSPAIQARGNRSASSIPRLSLRIVSRLRQRPPLWLIGPLTPCGCICLGTRAFLRTVDEHPIDCARFGHRQPIEQRSDHRDTG